MLFRALKHVENGFYIDVGANDPTDDSVTKAFYDRGWHGINIEPLPSHHADLVRDRPRDINLQCAAGAVNGEIEIWECDVRGWATAAPDVIACHTADGHEGILHKVPVIPLSEVCAQHVSGEVHFLKIDVEGFEKSVIDGIDFSRIRPWILVIESTRPNTTEEMHIEWEGSVLCSGYKLAYMDGLNRFYVSNERADLLGSLRYPPNTFDHFVRSDEFNLGLRVQDSTMQVYQLQAQLAGVYASSSWRVTRPLRLLAKVQFRLLCDAKQTSQVALRQVLKNVISFFKARPRLKRTILKTIRTHPRLEQQLRLLAVIRGRATIGNGRNAIRASHAHTLPTHLKQLTPRARQIYLEVKFAIEKNRQEIG